MIFRTVPPIRNSWAAMNQFAPNRRRFLQVAAGALGSASVLKAAADDPISIDVGRQLFVDDYLIAETSLHRSFHKPRLHDANPILKPETPLELNGGKYPVACPFQDGVFYDPKDHLYKMWYHAGWHDGTGYAYSEDGVRWVRPNLDVEPGTNRVLADRADYKRDGTGVWLDLETQDPSERFKLFAKVGTYEQGGLIFTSPDGIHWKERGHSGPTTSNTNFFYDPFRKDWVYSIRTLNQRGQRVRSYVAAHDFIKASSWTPKDVTFYASADEKDLPDPVFGYPTELYNLDAVGYESILLGVFAIHRGPPNEVCQREGFPKVTDLNLAYSRDGIHWDRPDRSSFLACSKKVGAWDRGYLHASGGVCVIAGDELRFYYGGFSGVSPILGSHMYAGASTGLATLRRDGFCSMDAGPQMGTLTTQPLRFKGRYLFVNANSRGGDLTVEVLGPDGKAVRGFARNDCKPLRADGTRQQVRWRSTADLAALRDHPISLRFHAVRAQLFSFWISPEQSGASHGYVAAGGPGFTGPTDTIGGRA